ncbi:MAG: hypothetical protein AAGE59_30655 [Cyanobacteria bacterium P01_F01_bin.86]
MTIPQTSTNIQPPSTERLQRMRQRIQIEIGAIEDCLATNWLKSLCLSLETAAIILDEQLPPGPEVDDE